MISTTSQLSYLVLISFYRRKGHPQLLGYQYLIYYGYYFIEENDIHYFSVIISGPDIIL